MFFKRKIQPNAFQELTDEELIKDISIYSHKQIVAEFYNRYGYMVFGVCLKYFKNKEDAEDKTIEVFSILEAKLKNNTIHHFRPWLHSLTRNECLMELRKRKAKKNSNIEIEVSENDEEIEIRLENEKWLHLLPDLTTQLNELQGTCIDLFYFKNQSYQVISEALSIPIKEVKSHLQNGKRNLRNKIIQLKNENNE